MAKFHWQLLISYLKPQWLKLVFLLGMLLSTIILQLIIPQLLETFINSALAHKPLSFLLLIAIFYIILTIIIQLFTVLVDYMSAYVGWITTNVLREDLATHCLQLDLSFHIKHMPGEFIERIDGDILAVSTFFSDFVINILGNLLLLIGIILFISVRSWYIGLVLALFVIVAAFILYRNRTMAVNAMLKYREASAKLFGFIEERLGALEDIRTNDAGRYVMGRSYEHARRYFYTRCASYLKSIQFGNILSILFMVGSLSILAWGIALNQQKIISVGTVYLFFQYTLMLRRPLDQITQQIQELQGASANILRIQELLQTPREILDGNEDVAVVFHNTPICVSFNQVRFAYHAGETILSDITFTVEPGKTLGLVGPTGSGKSTIGRLLFRFYDIETGAICINGNDIRSLPLTDLRRQIGLVTQDVQIFHATVRHNLTFFDPNISDEQILNVLGDLGMMDWYSTLPDGLETELISSDSLSSGQAQLLAFARVFLKDPHLIILDEASSRLDLATERLIERAIDKLIAERTCIIIAHRLQTLRKVDEILVLEHGQIQEHGPRIELMNNTASYFSHLFRTGQELEL